MHLNVFTECSPSPQFVGMWRPARPPPPVTARWTTGPGWPAGWRPPAWTRCSSPTSTAPTTCTRAPGPPPCGADDLPSIDPIPVVSAAAAVTRELGFAVTYSTTYHQPYETARLFSSLDHLTRRPDRLEHRHLLPGARPPTTGSAEYLDHDVRYDRADEYMRVVTGAVERQLGRRRRAPGAWAGDVFADPGEGARDRAQGPVVHRPAARTSASRRRSAPRCSTRPAPPGAGLAFAAEHAEVVFLTMADPQTGREQVAKLRSRVAAAGRDPAG